MTDAASSWRHICSRLTRFSFVFVVYEIALSIGIALLALVTFALVAQIRGNSSKHATAQESTRDSTQTSALDERITTLKTRGPFNLAVDSPLAIPFMIVAAGAALLATRPYVASEGFSWSDVGLSRSRAGYLFGSGLVVGIVSFAVVPLIGLMTGGATMERGASDFRPLLSLLIATLVLVPAAVSEEVAVRGFPMAILARKGRVPAVLITAIVFMLYHIPNPGGGSPGAILGILASGVALACGRLITGSLWLPIGWHFGWNLSQGWLFGCVVSGSATATTPLFSTQFSGSRLAFGGDFGPESGLVGTLATLTGLAMVVALRSRITPRSPEQIPPYQPQG